MNIVGIDKAIKGSLLAVLLTVCACACMAPGLAFASAQPDPLDHAAAAALQGAGDSASQGSALGLMAAAGGSKGIDVSAHQGAINWASVKASGVEFAILRIGYGGDYEDQDDGCFDFNVSECERLGIPYGVYLYSYAWDAESAVDEAAHVLRLLDGHHPQYPVYYDLECERNGQPAGIGDTVVYLSNDDLTKIATAFCGAISDAGYAVGVYANLNWWNNHLTDSVFDGWERWVAQWSSACSYGKAYLMWQCSNSGSVSGVSGNVDVDCDYCDSRPGVGVALGDANGNGVINIVDAQITLDAANGAYGEDLAEIVALRSCWSTDSVTHHLLDANQDGALDAEDARVIQGLAHAEQ